MKELQCIVVDDEPIARQILENYIETIPNLVVIASCKNALEALEVLHEKQVDLLFLDINMPKFSGLSLLKTIQQKPSVIITTAYPEYAIEGFELAVTDYLLKPFSLERFLQAVLKVQHKQPKTETSNLAVNLNKVQTSVFVKSDKKIIKVNFDDILYIEAYGNYIKIFADKMILTPQTLSSFLEKLPDSFIRVHKSFIINFNKLKLIDGNQVILENNSKLPLGKLYRKSILDKVTG
ncbi:MULTISPECIES: LytR/AlgR family response regulator transcription factor [unclassified Cellulophaga]|uniref:LytR/AlgR family response regulator transcription factor n=1 Tax=unclassified Cellulophaga TaxID=2634405 RepID=UPI0026E26224|nr:MULTISPECIES: LytTR family DNA-binding domain-containing protein [unclassified Cellulophaga]MDO6492494.1 LytTR family DNA-binding domain-containing protein [Cellulophaga sp. 2_MG-2023]MDO6493596.1 LytTR family DNA-binding domain-containing protein [Cellulophaga sp. 3_MG-2023]